MCGLGAILDPAGAAKPDAAQRMVEALRRLGGRRHGAPNGGTLTGMPPERTPDGRYVVIDGRRWRASDPRLPEERRQELVDELMSARRAVAAARRDADPEAERRARARVHEAKVALGERGKPWWEPGGERT